MVTIENLHKSFSSSGGANDLFHGLNLNIAEGQALTILGPNGCGKSTLLNLITGVDTNYSGQIRIKGSLDKKPSNVAYMQQKNLLLPWLTVEQNICLGIDIQSKVTDATQSKIDTLLCELHIPDTKKKYPTKLSGGERQKVALIRTLILNTPVLLLDEPFSAIDCWTRGNLQKVILSHIKENCTTLILVTHDVEEAIIMSDRVLVLNEKANGVNLDLQIELPKEERNPASERSSTFNTYYNTIMKNHPQCKN